MYFVEKKFNTMDEVKDYVDCICQNASYEVMAISEGDKYRVNARSILGVLSFDLSQPVTFKFFDYHDSIRVTARAK